MGVERIQKFTCDRCGEIKEMPSSEQPEGWKRATVGEPVLANPFEAKTLSDMTLCLLCGEGLLAFLGGGYGAPVPDEAPAHV